MNSRATHLTQVSNDQALVRYRMPTRLGIAIALSLCVHVLFVSGTMRGLVNLFPWLSQSEPPPTVVHARIEALPPPAPPPVVVPAPPAPPAPAPVVRRPPRPAPPRPAAPAVLAAPASTEAPVVAQGDAAATTAPAPAPVNTAREASTPDAAPAPPPASPATSPKVARTAPLPPRVRIDFEMTLESNNYKVWATQDWSMKDGRYRIFLSAKARALFFTLGTLTMESAGAITADGLRPERYVDDRNGKRTVVTFSANEKTAEVDEPNGNHKSLALSGQAADVMSITYDLAFNPEVAVGTVFTLSNRDNVEELRLADVRNEVLSTASGNLNTRYYDFRRANGSGGMQVWLAVDQGWLPARLRIMGRDGAVSMTATKYDLNPAD